jgi:MFS family permease
VSAFARVYGKRPQFLLASIFGIVGTIICETSGSSYNQLLAGRIVQGVAIAAYESVSFTVVGDLYFVHERGVRLSIINMVFTSVTGLASIIGGPITSNLGWRWMFHIFVISSSEGKEKLMVDDLCCDSTCAVDLVCPGADV